MKVLITGGGGFLGYRLALELLKKGTLSDAQKGAIRGEQPQQADDTAVPVAESDAPRDTTEADACWPKDD